jgi:AraC-like DNA-binding protein
VSITVRSVAVSARPAKDLTAAANALEVDLRASAAQRAGTYLFEGDDPDGVWHSHPMHQIQYAFEGIAEVESQGSHYVLPPHQAGWIPAGLVHRTRLHDVRALAVFFEPSMVHGAGDRIRVLAARPVIREMLDYAVRWPIDRTGHDPVAESFFDTLALLGRDWLDDEVSLSLPTSSDPLTREVMEVTRAHLVDVTLAKVCAAVGTSERSLRRHFADETGMTWRSYLCQARLLRAMSLLTERGRSVLDVATDVGFESVSAFARAFIRVTGETPTAYRRRVTIRGSAASAVGRLR